MRRVTIKIYGRVQGVFFRDAACREARKLGLLGFVQNAPDGTVEIVAEGEEAKLREFLKWGGEGPEYAQVDKIEEKWAEATGEFPNFQAR